MNGWRKVQITDIGQVFDGPHATPKTVDEGPVFLGIPSLNSGRLDLTDTRHVTEEDFFKWTKRVTPAAGDIVFSYETKIGEAALIPDGLRCCLGRRMGLVRLDPTKCDPRYFLYQYISPDYQRFLASRTVHGATVDRLLLKDFPFFEFPLPPLPEQREIASILGALDDKIDLNRRMAATLEEMARALYRSWFVDFDPVKAKAEGLAPAFMDEATAALFPDRFRDDGLPEEWGTISFVDVIDIISGGTPKTSEPSYWGGEIPWYSVVDAPGPGQIFVIDTEKTITEQGLKNSPARLVPRGTTIISARGTVGKLAMTSRQMTFNQSCYGLRSRRNRGDAFCYFATERAVGDLQSRSHGSVFSTITRQTFESVDVVDCSNAVLEAFAERVDGYLARICALVEQNRTLSALRDSLLPKLMSGELRVGEARDQIEEVA